MADQQAAIDPLKAQRKIGEAQTVLRALGLPKGQQNDRSALTLLALLDLGPDTPWADAAGMLRGIRQILDFIRKVYGHDVAENTRESYRNDTMHHFVEAGIVLHNPDDPARAVNSSKNAYQVEPTVLGVLRMFGTPEWERSLRAYLAEAGTLQERYAQDRAMQRIPVTLADGAIFTLSPGGQNILIERIINEFCPRFTPGGVVLYVGDTGSKFGHARLDALKALGIHIQEHGKMPDIVVHHTRENWLVLIEAVSSHGPMDPKRRDELRRVFEGSTTPLGLVTAFMTRQAMATYSERLAWETEAWVAEAPSHMIHYNGERFLGPYPPLTPGQ